MKKILTLLALTIACSINAQIQYNRQNQLTQQDNSAVAIGNLYNSNCVGASLAIREMDTDSNWI